MWTDCYFGNPGNSSMELSINDLYKLAGTSKEGFLTSAEVLNNNESLAATYSSETGNFWCLQVTC